MNVAQIINRIERLLNERHQTLGSLMNNADISTTVYQWKKSGARDATRTPSLKSIEKICNYFDISLAYFFAEDKSAEMNVKQKELAEMASNLDEQELDAVIGVVRAMCHKKHSESENGVKT